MDITRRQDRLFRLAILGALLFFLLTAAAMVLYPGGTPGDPSCPRYLFFENVFSDLGRTHAYDGDANFPSMALFMAGTFAAAVSITSFFVAFAHCFAGHRFTHLLGRLAASLGMASAIFFVLVACVPYDLCEGPHLLLMMFAVPCLLASTLLALLALLITPLFPRRFALMFALLGVPLTGYVILMAANLSGYMNVIQALIQKLAVYSVLLAIIVQSLAMRGHLRDQVR